MKESIVCCITLYYIHDHEPLRLPYFIYKELQSHAMSIVLHVAIRKKLMGPNNSLLWQNLLRDMRYKVYFDEV